MRKQAGFTLIELIMVIVILGILAATALPKFADLSKDARYASAKGAQGAIASAAAIAHSAWLVAGSSAAPTVTMEGATISMAFGYPDTGVSGIQSAANLTSPSFTISANGAATQTFAPQGVSAANINSCSALYTKATSLTAPAQTALNGADSALCN